MFERRAPHKSRDERRINLLIDGGDSASFKKDKRKPLVQCFAAGEERPVTGGDAAQIRRQQHKRCGWCECSPERWGLETSTARYTPIH